MQCEYELNSARKNCSSSAESADSNSNFALDLNYTTVFYNVSILQMNYWANFQRAAFMQIHDFIIKRIFVIPNFQICHSE